ncbi:hypothetical protein K438DRAFT_1809842 [Mycena galopus ATCC 62051]|nr:hypothetical protein K438DRAFT_1885212 [Mycena galopus ATCC 62051]KAF8199303.1 hypothetical protein K438DRAFT_1823389 [Mycena galopus ATCC 62051]KAF8210520.1 hypothetical protein K438DRAFT_1809842 [Mycena galopus ATCC 62051]
MTIFKHRVFALRKTGRPVKNPLSKAIPSTFLGVPPLCQLLLSSNCSPQVTSTLPQISGPQNHSIHLLGATPSTSQSPTSRIFTTRTDWDQ